MATVKKSGVTMREEMRLLEDVVVNTPDDQKDRLISPEFWAMAVTAVTNLVAVGVMVGWVDSGTSETLTKALTALIGASEAIIVNSVLIWKYFSSKNQLKEKMMATRLRCAELAVERLKLTR